jgi:hypothetical protein
VIQILTIKIVIITSIFCIANSNDVLITMAFDNWMARPELRPHRQKNPYGTLLIVYSKIKNQSCVVCFFYSFVLKYMELKNKNYHDFFAIHDKFLCL